MWEVRYHPVNPNFVISCGGDGNIFLWAGKDKIAGLDDAFQFPSVSQIWSTPGFSISSFDIDVEHNMLVCSSDNESICVATLPI